MKDMLSDLVFVFGFVVGIEIFFFPLWLLHKLLFGMLTHFKVCKGKVWNGVSFVDKTDI